MAEAVDLGLDHGLDDRVKRDDPKCSVPATLDEYFELPWAIGDEKLGGWPGWVNIATPYPDCPECGHRMDGMVFQFGFQGYIPVMFGDGGQGQIVNCPRHPDIFAYPWTCG